MIFAMVANRVSATPLSKLATCEWAAKRSHVDGLMDISDDACYRAMDFLLDALAELQEAVFFTVANLLNLEVDLLFFDTSSTYFETDRLDWVVAQQAKAQGRALDDVRTDAQNKTVLKRFVRPEEITDAVVFLAGNHSKVITGADLNIAAGVVMY